MLHDGEVDVAAVADFCKETGYRKRCEFSGKAKAGQALEHRFMRCGSGHPAKLHHRTADTGAGGHDIGALDSGGNSLLVDNRLRRDREGALRPGESRNQHQDNSRRYPTTHCKSPPPLLARRICRVYTAAPAPPLTFKQASAARLAPLLLCLGQMIRSGRAIDAAERTNDFTRLRTAD